ncbi:thymidylate synthase [Pseudomonas sp. NZIPFR-PS5]|nr:thymidylate synthase [Pseudomonas sp. NZIPFR-PS5]
MPFTLTGPCEFREEIRKSRFITLAAPIDTAADAQAFIEEHSDLDATHNCWAYIDAQDFDQVVVLVIRWYGGIQLGTGGLARAYGGGANKCLQQADRVPLINRVSLQFDCSFSELVLIKLRLAELNGLVEDERFNANGVTLSIALGPEQIETLQRQLSDISRGRIVLQPPQ